MMTLTGDRHLEPFFKVFYYSHQHVGQNSINFFLNGFFSIDPKPRTFFKNLRRKISPQKKSQELKFNDCDDHRTASCIQTTRPGNISWKILRRQHALQSLAPSCRNQKSTGLCSFLYFLIFGHRKFFNMLQHRSELAVTVTLPFSKK